MQEMIRAKKKMIRKRASSPNATPLFWLTQIAKPYVECGSSNFQPDIRHVMANAKYIFGAEYTLICIILAAVK